MFPVTQSEKPPIFGKGSQGSLVLPLSSVMFTKNLLRLISLEAPFNQTQVLANQEKRLNICFRGDTEYLNSLALSR